MAEGFADKWSEKLLGPLMMAAIVSGILALPVVFWLDLSSLSERVLKERAGETGRIINIMRSFYSSDVVGRILHADHQVTASSNYKNINGAVPIPATLSIELGNLISQDDSDVKYRFVSDLPFQGREPHVLDAFEKNAIATLRNDPKAAVSDVSGSLFNRQLRVVSPVVMGQACVECHNSHPGSPKTDWKVGDVRGIQEITVLQPIDANILSFKYLLTYIAAGGTQRCCTSVAATAPVSPHFHHQQGSGGGKQFSRRRLHQDCEIHFAANLQEHLQRRSVM